MYKLIYGFPLSAYYAYAISVFNVEGLNAPVQVYAIAFLLTTAFFVYLFMPVGDDDKGMKS